MSMSQTGNTGGIVERLRRYPKLVRASIAGLLFLAFCFFLWDHFYRQDDPCYRLSEEICESLRPQLLICQKTTQAQKSYQEACDVADPNEDKCAKLRENVEIKAEQCSLTLRKQRSCVQAKQALVDSNRTSTGSCSHALEMMVKLWPR